MMSANNERAPILGEVKLDIDSEIIPQQGLAYRRLRVDVFITDEDETGWMAELENQGDLPWFTGESRLVELRVLDRATHQKIMALETKVYLRRGADPIGVFSKLKKIDSSKN